MKAKDWEEPEKCKGCYNRYSSYCSMEPEKYCPHCPVDPTTPRQVIGYQDNSVPEGLSREESK